jgi:hypothetical protein
LPNPRVDSNAFGGSLRFIGLMLVSCWSHD